jgi:hypothetical protein
LHEGRVIPAFLLSGFTNLSAIGSVHDSAIITHRLMPVRVVAVLDDLAFADHAIGEFAARNYEAIALPGCTRSALF